MYGITAYALLILNLSLLICCTIGAVLDFQTGSNMAIPMVFFGFLNFTSALINVDTIKNS